MLKVLNPTPRANRLLAALDAEDFAHLEPYLETVSLARGEVLYETGDIISHAYFPHDAIVSLVKVLEDGTTVEVAVLGREGGLGLVGPLVSRESFGRYLVQISGTASRIPLERLDRARTMRPHIQQAISRFEEAFLGQLLQIVACNAVHPVEARCCRWILSTHDRVDQDTLPLTHEFLAEMLGVQRSTVSIVTRTLQTAGLISQSRGVITVTDRAGLEEGACECYGVIRQAFEKLLPGTYTRANPT